MIGLGHHGARPSVAALDRRPQQAGLADLALFDDQGIAATDEAVFQRLRRAVSPDLLLFVDRTRRREELVGAAQHSTMTVHRPH
jgi:hypothetical protein